MDYSKSGLSIQAAMVDFAKKHPDKKSRPKFIQWGDYQIRTWDTFTLPSEGKIRAVFKKTSDLYVQGFDLSFEEGCLLLEKDEEIPLLRTWYDAAYEDDVEYEFKSTDGKLLWFWNVTKRKWPNGSVTEEKLTGNAGFWIEHISDLHRIYHCSSAEATPPNFDSLVVEVQIMPE